MVICRVHGIFSGHFRWKKLSIFAYPLLCRYVKRGWTLGVIALLLLIAGPFFRTILAPNDTASDYAYFANFDRIALGCVAGVLARSVRIAKPVGVLFRTIG